MYLLSEPVAERQALHVDFAFIGKDIARESLCRCLGERTLICAGNPDSQLVTRLDDSAVVVPQTGIDIAIGDEDFWRREDVIIIDVRERRSIWWMICPAARVINVPLTQVVQFIHDNSELQQRELICVCSSRTAAALLPTRCVVIGY